MNFKTKIKYIILPIILLVFTLSIKLNINADTNDTTDSISLVGAQIRTEGVQGLRFVTLVDFDTLGISKSNITKYGTVVSFGEANKDDLYIGATINDHRTLYAESSSMSFPDEDKFSLVLYNFNSNQYSQKYSARSYIKYMDGETEKIIYSSNVISRSIYEVAKNVYSTSPSEYANTIINSVEANDSAITSIENAKSEYESDNTKVFKIKAVVTAVSTGTYRNACIEDSTGALTVFNFASTYVNSMVVGNEILIETSLTKFNGLYETNSISSITVLNKANEINDKYIDVNNVFDTNVSYQSHLVKGFLRYNNTSNKNINFYTVNDNAALVYNDAKWSSYTIETLTTGDYYYVKGVASYYNKNQIIPIDANPFTSITSIEATNVQPSYLLDDFDISSIVLKITLSDGTILYKNASLEMLSDDDNVAIQTSGSKTITILYLGKTISLSFTLNEKEVSSIEVLSMNNTYYVGDNINLSNAYIKVNYVDSTYVTRNIDESYISGFDTTTSGSKAFTITYSGVSTNYNYNVYKKIVIYDVYGAGGNSGATYQNDYVVLYNNTSSDISLSGYKLLYASSTGTSFSSTLDLSGTIYANSYYVIKLKSNNVNNGSTFDYSNATSDTFDMSASKGRVAIVNGSKPDSVTDDSLIDNVLFTGLSATKSYKRTSLLSDAFSAVSVSLSYLDSETEIKKVTYSGLKTTYLLNASLDLTNVSFFVTRRNGKTETVTLTNSNVTGFSTMQYGTFEMTFTIDTYLLKVNYSVTESGEAGVDVRIYYIDLGDDLSCCGESTYIQVGSGTDAVDILIDAGEKTTTCGNAIRKVINEHCEDNKLEYVIATHIHSDHIGGMQYVLPYYTIDNVIEFDYKYGKTASSTGSDFVCKYLYYRAQASNVYTALSLITNNGGSTYTINLATDVSLTLYNTGLLDSTDTSDKNKQSIVCTINAFGTKVLFNGDAEKAQEAVYGPLVGDVDIFKVGHHGTYNATTANLLSSITPEVAIICNGNYLGNEYGHPTIEALSRLYSYSSSIKVYAITGANVEATEETTGSTAGSTNRTLYYKNLSSGYVRTWFKCSSTSDAMLDRNGDITVTINSTGYSIVSEFFGSTLREMKDTEYYKQIQTLL